ncbi:MAG TPA: acetolactate synthase small subunit [Polyangiales bacterium]|jgi:acetolactate synthase-1/3 small subunit|nr:acetolactate synthase small subunit [Polyangiales bacterium]
MTVAVNNALHTVSIITKDQPGVLVRIALVFARRGYNIESLAVSPGAKEGFARMTITSRGDAQNTEQILRQLTKLIDVVYVTDHRDKAPVEVEIALVKLRAARAAREDILRIAENFESQIVDDEEETVMLRVTGTSAELDDCIGALRPYGVEELIRSGKIVMDSGASNFAHLMGGAS